MIRASEHLFFKMERVGWTTDLCMHGRSSSKDENYSPPKPPQVRMGRGGKDKNKEPKEEKKAFRRKLQGGFEFSFLFPLAEPWR